MKISASLYSNKQKSLAQLVSELDLHGIDLFHIDCKDDIKVFEDIREIRKLSDTPIDLHIISSNPEKYLELIAGNRVEYVSFQFENLSQLPEVKSNGVTQFGLSVSANTPIDVFSSVANDYSFVMMMCTTPGESGGVFNQSSFQKIIDFRNKFPKTKVHVDGGVNDEIAYILRLLGVNTVVSGSYLMNHESLGKGLLSFHQSNTQHVNFKASEFATPVAYLPVIKEKELTFELALLTLENYGLGFVLITDEIGMLKGIVSNADVRRALIKNIGRLQNISADELVNRSPVVVKHNSTVNDIVHMLNELNFIVLFLPVINEKHQLTGALSLNNLIRV